MNDLKNRLNARLTTKYNGNVYEMYLHCIHEGNQYYCRASSKQGWLRNEYYRIGKVYALLQSEYWREHIKVNP